MKKGKKERRWKQGLALGIACMLALGAAGCERGSASAEMEETVQETEAEFPEEEAETEQTGSPETTEEQEESMQIVLSVNGTELDVTWEDNETVRALRQALESGDIAVATHQYGDFEQVGSLPQEFVRNDVQMRTEPGDIVLYSGNSVVLFYGSNSWAYTKLGHIENKSQEELETLLGGENAQIVMSLAE